MSELFLLSGFSNALVSAGLDPDVRATLSESPIQEMCEELVGHELVVQNYTFAKPVYPTGRPKSSCVRQVLQKGKWYAPKCREVVRATPGIGLCSWSEVSV